uniref:Cyanobacterial aminoacyl-tRNA synthetase CAAD domain-containing protein n=1 Tax=Ananas comosus var. bracteatus TaxID=296719 RepID=A0A6V7PUG3_ANACO|nr:unnamed protein product [Ananas comosus var. bracteatus]
MVMAFAFSIATPQSLMLCGNKALFGDLPKIPAPTVAGRKRHSIAFAKAAGDSSESSSSGSIVKYVQNAWNSSEDRIALAGFGFAAIVAIWASVNLIGAIDKLPVVQVPLSSLEYCFLGGSYIDTSSLNLIGKS